MATQKQVEDAVSECLRHVPFEQLDKLGLDAPFDDFWKRIEQQDVDTGRELHRVDLFIRCLKEKLGSPTVVTRDMLLEQDLTTPRDVVLLTLG
jgi:hypothetical protein